MKKITNLKDVVSGYDGKPIGGMEKITTKSLLLRYCIEYQGKNIDSYFLADKTGHKIFDCKKDELELEDAEYNFLESEVKNNPKHVAIAMVLIFKSMGIKSSK